MQIKPFTALLPSAAGQQKITTGQTDWQPGDVTTQPGTSYYWYEVTVNGLHQWRLIARWPVDQTVTTMLPGPINTVLYPQQPVIEMLIDDWVGHFPQTVNLTDPFGTNHRLWQITETEVNADITEALRPVEPRKTWLTTTSTPLVMLVANTEWAKLPQAPEIPAHLIDCLNTAQ